MHRFAKTPEPPYYAVIFSNQHSNDLAEYEATATRMLELAATMEGFLGAESTRDSSGFGITVSYWRDESCIARWKAHAEHSLARDRGKRQWYSAYRLRVAKVEREYSFGTGD